jgi:hypothetical protein
MELVVWAELKEMYIPSYFVKLEKLNCEPLVIGYV